MVTELRSRGGPSWTGVSGVTSTGSARPPPTAIRSTRRPSWARFPSASERVERWQSAAGAIEAYRARWNVTTVDALGPEPLDPEQRAHWQRAVAAIGSAGFAAPGGPGSGPDEAWLSSLWDRVHALDAARPDSGPRRDIDARTSALRVEPRRRLRTRPRRRLRVVITFFEHFVPGVNPSGVRSSRLRFTPSSGRPDSTSFGQSKGDDSGSDIQGQSPVIWRCSGCGALVHVPDERSRAAWCS